MKEENVKKVRYFTRKRGSKAMWYIGLVVFAGWLSSVNGLAQQHLNLERLKQDTEIFERIVHEVLKQNFSDPFAITSEPRGAYLQGYGMLFSFQINVNRRTIRTPFGEVRDPRPTSRRTTEEHMRVIRTNLIDVLIEYGDSIKQLGGHDRISIAAYVDDRNELDARKSRKTLVLTASKDDVDLVAMKKISAENFKDRIDVMEY